MTDNNLRHLSVKELLKDLKIRVSIGTTYLRNKEEINNIIDELQVRSKQYWEGNKNE